MPCRLNASSVVLYPDNLGGPISVTKDLRMCLLDCAHGL